MIFSASVDGNGCASVDGATLTVSPALDCNGYITVSVFASDCSVAEAWNTSVIVIHTNDSVCILFYTDNLTKYRIQDGKVIENPDSER